MAEPYLELLSEQIATLDLPDTDGVLLESRHFFSGAALYANGRICASLTPAGFGLKLPAEVRDGLIGNGEGRELRYFPKAPIKKQYVVLSESLVDDPKALRSLLEQCIAYVTDGVAGFSENKQ